MKKDITFITQAYIYRPALLKIAQIKLRNSFDAEDAVEDSILHAYDKREQLRDTTMLYPWLKRILINHCNDLFRQPIIDENALQINNSNNSPEQAFEKNQRLEDLLDLMLTIEPEEYAEVLILHYYRNLSYQQIAQETDCAIGTVKSRLSRAREQLAKSIRTSGMTLEDAAAIKHLSEWPTTKFN